jgi:hypothetical protein
VLDPFADTLREPPEVPRDLLPVAGELGRVLVSFFDDITRILEVRPSSPRRPAADPGSHHDPRDDARSFGLVLILRRGRR